MPPVLRGLATCFPRAFDSCRDVHIRRGMHACLAYSSNRHAVVCAMHTEYDVPACRFVSLK